MKTQAEHTRILAALILARKAAWEAYNNAPIGSNRDALLDAALSANRAYDAAWVEARKDDGDPNPGVEQGQFRGQPERKHR
jgi:hypothetical protein